MSKYIDKIGIELEGGWNKIPHGSRIIKDLSIDGSTLETDRVLSTYHVGEIVSDPLPLSAWREWVEHNYPSDMNVTCGLHVHTSHFNSMNYSHLMTTAFEAAVKEEQTALAIALNLPRRHYIWRRMENQNPFARFFRIRPQEQLYITQKRISMPERYSAINFCFSLHGTVEYRALPMFEDAHMAILFIDNYLKIIERFLAEQKTYVRFSSSLKVSGGQLVCSERNV